VAPPLRARSELRSTTGSQPSAEHRTTSSYGPSCDRPSSACARRGTTAGALALRGFEATLRGVQARINFHENDSGNIEAATRDARRANVELSRGAKLLRAAGRLLDTRVGSLNGY
jgi:hypothetical protein